jgi:hypothetical protein
MTDKEVRYNDSLTFFHNVYVHFIHKTGQRTTQVTLDADTFKRLWSIKYIIFMLHKRLKVSVSSVTRVVGCPVLWIKCVVNNVMFFYIHTFRDRVNGVI